MSFQLYFTLSNEGSFGAGNVLDFIFSYKFQLDCSFTSWTFKFIELIDWSLHDTLRVLFFIRTHTPLIFLSLSRINSSTSPCSHLIRGIATLNQLLSATPSMLHTSFSCGVTAASWVNGQNHWKMYVKETKINRIKRNRNVKNSVDTVKLKISFIAFFCTEFDLADYYCRRSHWICS